SNRRHSFDNLSTYIKPGEMLGIICYGTNANETLIDALCGYTHLTKGDALTNGTSLNNDTDDFMAKTAASFQVSSLNPLLTGTETLELFLALHGISYNKALIDKLLSIVFLDEKADSQVQTLSDEHKQKLGIALVILKMPNLFLFEEPSCYLDLIEYYKIF